MTNEYAVKEMLNGINMGMISIDYFEDKIVNQSLRNLVLKQRKDYGKLKDHIRQDYPGIEDVLKHQFMVETMLSFKSVMSDDKKISKMMVEGCNQGIMTMNKLINEGQLDEQVLSHMKTLINLSHDYLEQFKPYL